MNQVKSNVTTLPVEQVNSEPQPPHYGGKPVTLQTFDPWPEPVGGDVIDEYQELLSRFMFVTKREQLLCTLWTVHANCYDCTSSESCGPEVT